jgi:hypothetical protein
MGMGRIMLAAQPIETFNGNLGQTRTRFGMGIHRHAWKASEKYSATTRRWRVARNHRLFGLFFR